MSRNLRPSMKDKKVFCSKVLEAISIVITICLWLIVAVNYNNLPDTIPSHFNASGTVDGYNDKSSIWGVPIAGTVIWAILTIVNRFPYVFRFPNGSKSKSPAQINNARSMLRILKLICVTAFFFIVSSIIYSSTREVGPLFLPIFIFLITISTVVFLYKYYFNR
jgi:uncharacterized membrane protein